MATALGVRGLMNVQFAVQPASRGRQPAEDSTSPGAERPGEARYAAGSPVVYVLEVNPRASRTVPFVSKATGVPLAKHATLVMVGKTLDELAVNDEVTPRHYSVKESVFPFNKFPGVDIILGPEMRSTGEVMGIDDSMPMAFAKSQLAANSPLPRSGTVFLSVNDRDKAEVVGLARAFAAFGYTLIATRGTAADLRKHGVPVTDVLKLHEGRPNLVDLMKNGSVALVINTPSGHGTRSDDSRIRASAVQHGVTCITTLSAAHAAVEACRALRDNPLRVMTLQERFVR
jgi:carbamoyl-phosphate synthase large subunit